MLLGRTGAGTPYRPRLAFGANGVLYDISTTGTTLYSISTTTGTATTLATLSGTPAGGGDLRRQPG